MGNIRHTEYMRTLVDLRAETPDDEFITRPLPCPNGAIHLMTVSQWFWEKLDILLQVNATISQSDIIQFCFTLAERSVTEEGWEFDIAFRELLMYYIYRNYQGYIKLHDNLANDHWEDCFTHLEEAD